MRVKTRNTDGDDGCEDVLDLGSLLASTVKGTTGDVFTVCGNGQSGLDLVVIKTRDGSDFPQVCNRHHCQLHGMLEQPDVPLMKMMA